MRGGVAGAMILFYLIWLVPRRLLGEKVRSQGVLFRGFWKGARVIKYGKIVKIYTQLKSGFLFATPLILASCWSHLRVCTGNLHTYGFLPLKYTRF